MENKKLNIFTKEFETLEDMQKCFEDWARARLHIRFNEKMYWEWVLFSHAKGFIDDEDFEHLKSLFKEIHVILSGYEIYD